MHVPQRLSTRSIVSKVHVGIAISIAWPFRANAIDLEVPRTRSGTTPTFADERGGTDTAKLSGSGHSRIHGSMNRRRTSAKFAPCQGKSLDVDVAHFPRSVRDCEMPGSSRCCPVHALQQRLHVVECERVFPSLPALVATTPLG
jgi:hypothetical protein